MNHMLRGIAIGRLKHNRSTTLLSMVAMILTTTMLMGLGTGAYGMVRITQESFAEQDGNQHAMLGDATGDQVDILARHQDVEALYVRERVAALEQDRIKANLMRQEQIKGEIRAPGITAGTAPVAEDDLLCPPMLLERLGVPTEIGQKVTLSLRLQGEGEIFEQEFTVCGLLEQQEIGIEVSDARIVYAAFVSDALADKWLEGRERYHYTYLRVYGEDQLSYGQMEEKINRVAADIGYPEELVNLNTGYLIWMVDLDPDMLVGVAGIALLIVGFCALVIYSIYYVSIITNIQDLGKIRALGATKRQMKGLLLREGMYTAAASIPVGLVLGYLLGRIGAVFVHTELGAGLDAGELPQVAMFHPLIVLAVIAVVLGTVVLSLLRPMGVVARISPMEAIRYQETTTGKKAERKGYETVSLTRLSTANMSRNRKRSAVTIMSLAAGCVLFMAMSGVLGGMSAEVFARRSIPKGDLYLRLDYDVNEATYVERNLDQMQLDGKLGADLVTEIEAMPGVTEVEREYIVLFDTDHPGHEENGRLTIGAVSREDFAASLADSYRTGGKDYDEMLAQGGIMSTSATFMDYYELEIGMLMNLTLYDGQERVDLQAPLYTAVARGGADYLMPEELFHQLITHVDATSGVYIYTEAYTGVKEAVTGIMLDSDAFELLSLDEEVRIAQYSNRMMLLIAYGFLLILGVVSMMNLINTMITSVVTRRRELGLLQAVGLADSQMTAMLQREGLVFTGSALAAGLTLGNLLGYGAYLWARHTGFSALGAYRYPISQTFIMILALVAGQVLITFFLSRYVRKDTVIERIAL